MKKTILAIFTAVVITISLSIMLIGCDPKTPIETAVPTNEVFESVSETEEISDTTDDTVITGEETAVPCTEVITEVIDGTSTEVVTEEATSINDVTEAPTE